MIWRASLKLLLLSLVFWAGQPGGGAAQPWNPFLGDQPTQHAILGHVAGLGPVLGPNGEQDIVEYDPQGFEVGRTSYEPGMFILSVDAWNAEVAQWNAAVQAAGEDNSDQLDIETYRESSEDGSRTCYDLAAGAASSLPPVLDDGVKWVLVKKVAQGLPVCSEYLLAVSTLDPPDAPISGGSSLILDGNRDVVTTSAEGNVFAYESAYFEPQAGFCPENLSLPPVLRNLVAYQACRSAQVAKIFAPISGVPLDTTQGLAFVPAVSSENGFFRLDYTSHGFDDESGTWVWGEVLLDAFNPRFPSSRKFYLKRRATGAGTVRSANFAIDLVQASVVAQLKNPRDPARDEEDPTPPLEVPLVDSDYQFAEFTEYEYSAPEFDEIEPSYSFANEPNVDYRHLGLVEQISAIDLQATDIYLYRVADGKLIGARRGLTPSNLVGITADPLQFPRAETPAGCEDNACIGLVMLTRGPASRATAEDAASLGGSAPYQSAVTSSGGSPNQVSLELEYLESEPAFDFLRPGDTVQVVAVNRVTGYLGSALGELRNNGLVDAEGKRIITGQVSIVDEDGNFGLSIAMLPPNLRVQAKRTFEVKAGQTSGGLPREYVIGFEGASLNTDTIVEIATTWVDHDGKPLPADLPGFTGRLASVMDDELVPEGDPEDSVDAVGHFSIQPGTHTQVARIPRERLDIGHLYLHIDAAPKDETVDFQNALIDRQASFAVNEVCYGSGDNCFPKPPGDGSNPLEQRPAHFVPFLVPMFDEAATRAATVAQRQELQDAWNEGDTLPILEKVDPIYQWVYRPEFKFAVLGLDVKGTDIVTDDQGTNLVVDYTLVGGDETQQLDPLGDNEFVFSLGYAELLATVLTDLASGEISQAEFDDVASILGLTTGGQLGSQADALGAILGPEDFLVLQLYLQHDSANGLFEFAFGSDLNVFADSRTLELERVHRRARYAHHPGLPEVPAYTDTYEFLNFEIKYDSSVEVVLIDEGGAETTILGPANLTPDRYRFVIDYQQIAGSGVTPDTSPTFSLEVRTSFTDENGSPATHKIVYDGVIREREQGEVIGQTIVNDVAIADGSLRLEREDFRVKGKGPDLAFVRTYSSSNPSSGAIGPAWRHQLAHQLVPIEAGDPAATIAQDAGIPGWVRGLQGGFIGTNVTPPAGQEWIEVLVSGTRFRKFGNDWYPERGRHGTFEELQTPDGDYFIYTAMDGTRYRYRVPSLIGETPTIDQVPVTVGDAAVYRVGLPPILNCPFAEDVVDITAPNGHKLVFKYSGDNETPGICGELVSVVEVDLFDRESRRIDLGYGSVPLQDPVSQESEGSARRLLSVAGPGGIALSFGYDQQGRLANATRASRIESYQYPTTNRDPYLTSASVVPGLGNPIQAYDYAYHQEGEIALAGTSYGEFLDPKQIVKSVTLPEDQVGARATVNFEYDLDATNQRRVRDARDKLTTYSLDDVGRPAGPNAIVGPAARNVGLEWDMESGYTKTRTEITSAGSRVTRYQYLFDADHRLARTEETGPYENKRITVYDPRFNKPVSRTDRNGFVETWQYDIDGNAMFYEDGQGDRWSFGYDSEKLLKTRGAPGRSNTTVFLYDSNGYVRSTQTETGDLTRTFYDDRGLLRERQDARGNPTFYFYDDLDNLTTVERPALETIAAARQAAQSQRLSQSQQLFTWDALGRKNSETDHNGLRLDYEYDGRGLVTRIQRPAIQGEDAEREFAYDPNGNLLSETDWKAVGTNDPSDVTEHTYNALNQRETTTNRVDDVMEYAYDQVGNLLHSIDYAGVKTEYTYDLLDRPLTMVRTRGAEPVGEEIGWEYYLEDDPEQNLKTKTVQRAPLNATEVTQYEINGRYQRLLRTNSRGGEYQWVYKGDGTIDYEIDEEGLRAQRDYYGDGRVRYEDRVGASGVTLRTEFEYDPVGNVTVVLDPKGNRIEREYDEWNRMFRSHVVAEGDTRFTTEILYDGEGNVLNVHDPEGRDRSTIRDALGRITQTIAGDDGVVDFRHDRNGNVVQQTEVINGRAGPVVTEITYDAEDRELCRTEAFGTTDARTRCVEEYDGVGNPKRVKDFRNAETMYAYDVNHQLIEAVLPGNDVLGWTYSQNGLLVSQRDALLRETEFAYDEIGRLAVTTDPAVEGIRDTEQRFYDEVGNLVRVVDRRIVDGHGLETIYTYDDFYRLRQVDREGELVATYGYDSAGNLRYEQDGNCDRIDHCYDARNLLTVSYVPNGDSANGVGCQATGTDPSLDSCPSIPPTDTDPIRRQYDGVGNLRTLTNEALQDTTFTYDGENRVLTESFAGETTTFTYDETGLIRTRRQPSGRTDTYVYDMLGRLKEAHDGGLLTTTYGYDANSNLTLTKLPSGAETAYTYDLRNRVETQVQDLGGLDLTTRFTYYENDNLRTLTDANGQLITYGYDEKNRRTSADYPAQPDAPFYEVQGITWSYDGNDNVTGVETQKQGPGGAVTDVTSFGYDGRDRLELATYRGRAVRYAYDAANQRIGVGTGPTIVEGGSNSTVYKYDARGRVTGVVTPSGQASYGYTPDGRLDVMTHPNGVDTDYSYTPQNRVASIEHSLGVTRLAEYAYTYDADGNRLSETATQVEGGALVQQTRWMAYDLANRLCAVAQGQGALTGVTLPNCNGAVGTLTGVEETRFAFNGYNRDRETVVVDGLASSGKVYDYDAANRLLTVDLTDGGSTTLSTLTYGYDRNGNTLSVTDSTAPTETMGFVYNPRDQLVQVTRGPPGGEAILGRYDYDAQGQRIRTEALGALTEEVYDGIALLARYQGGSEEAFVHRGPGGELLGVEAPSTPMQWMHTDVLGSPIVRTDDVGAVVASTRYGVFGDVAFREEPGAAQGPRFGFTGHQYDAGTELVYANARYYQPGLGRFLTQDAFLGRLQQPASVHRYLYAAHSPAVFFDPTGFETVCDGSGDCYNDESAFSMYFYDFRHEGRIVGRNIALATDQAGRSIGNNAARYYLSYEEGGVESVYSLAIDDTEGVIAEADERYTAGGGGISGLSEVARPYNLASFLLEGVYDTQLGIEQGDAALARRGIAKVTIGTVGLTGAGASGVGMTRTLRAGFKRARKSRSDTDLVTETAGGERAAARVDEPEPARGGEGPLLLANPEVPLTRRLTAGAPTSPTRARFLGTSDGRLVDLQAGQAVRARAGAAGGKRAGPYDGLRSPRDPSIQRTDELLPGELEVGQYGALPLRPGLSRHHIPSKSYLRERFGIDADDGVSIQVEQPVGRGQRGGRHRGTETYGRRPFVDESPRDALARDVADLRRIYQREGLYGREVRRALQDVIRENKRLFPELYEK